MITQENQSFFDIAIQEHGSVLAAFDWCLINKMSITDELYPGQKLLKPKSELLNSEVANYFKGKNQQIATSSTRTGNEIPEVLNGIGYMIIGNNFIIG